MRSVVLVALLLLALAGCATPRAENEQEPQISYNRRELPEAPGLFSGPDGNFTVYRNDAERAAQPAPPETSEAPPEPAPPKHREILMCDRSRNCEEPASAH